jgi:pyruvate/2-oxoglutarate dehydrogenase complex dihydrolipoamide acyltransferase (E2) component
VADTVIKITSKKKALFKHISRSAEYVQGTTFMEVDLGNIKELRQIRKASYTSYIAYAAAQGLKEFPLINSTLGEGEIILKGDINLGVALDHEGRLVVPVIKNADQYTAQEIDAQLKSFQEKAANSGMGIEDLEGGTFTLTNSGVFGSSFFTPIINYPQSAILGIAAINDKPVVRNGETVIRPICVFCLSYDHRVIEGSVAVRFLARVKETLETLK